MEQECKQHPLTLLVGLPSRAKVGFFGAIPPLHTYLKWEVQFQPLPLIVCYGLNVPPHTHSYVEMLTPNVMLLGGGAFGG